MGPRPRPALAWLASGTTVALLILGYLASHLAIRLLASPTLGIDDAEQALLAQRFAWGYQLRQPPLYTWLLLPAIAALGPNLLALSLVRYVLMGLTYGLMYGVARRWIEDRRLAALAVLSFAAIYMFGYYAHHDLTHTTALAAAIAASLYAFARLVERPTAVRYLMLGLCFGLGLLAKWNFVMLALGLPLTCLLDRRYRGLVLDPKLLLALAAMVVVAIPNVLWVLDHNQSALQTAGAVLVPEPEQGVLGALVAGTGHLARATLAYPMPFLALFAAAFGGALWRACSAPAPAPAPEPDAEPGAVRSRVTPGFLGKLIALILALHWLLIPTAGAVAFTEHWMHPALMILPVFLFAWVERGRPTPRALTAYLALLGLVVATALGARIVHYAEGADHCGRCRDLVPFAALAGQLRKAGFARGTIFADGMHIAGNLRTLFPSSRVLDPAYPSSIWPPPTGPGRGRGAEPGRGRDPDPGRGPDPGPGRGADLDPGRGAGRGQCLAIWPADAGAPARRQHLEAWLEGELGVAPDSVRLRGRVAAPMMGSRTKVYTLEYELWLDGPGACH